MSDISPAYRSRMGKAVSLFVSGFGALVTLLLVVEQIGIPSVAIAWAIFGFAVVTYVVLGLAARTMSVSVFYLASQRTMAFYNGMIIATVWAGGSVFLGYSGDALDPMGDISALFLGGVTGFLLMAWLLAPALQRSGAYTLPAVLDKRFQSLTLRGLAALVLVFVSGLLMIVQVRIAGEIGVRFLGLQQSWSFGGVAIILAASVMLGGMRGLTRVQMVQATVVMSGLVIPVLLLLALGMEFTSGQDLVIGGSGSDFFHQSRSLLDPTPSLTASLSSAPLASEALVENSLIDWSFWALVFCLATGTASLPYVLMRFQTSANGSQARSAALWAIVVAAFLLVSLPLYSVFVMSSLDRLLVGQGIEALPGWLFHPNLAGGLSICGIEPGTLQALQEACRAEGVRTLALSDIKIVRDMLLPVASHMVNMSAILPALVGIGLISATLAAASGLLLSISASVSHDLFAGILNRTAPSGRELTIARLLIILLVTGAVFLAQRVDHSVLTLVIWTFSLAGSAFFPSLVLGIWWRRCTATGALLGLLGGFATTLSYMLATTSLPIGWDYPLLWTLPPHLGAVFGIPAGFLLCVAGSLLQRQTPEMRRHVDKVMLTLHGSIQTKR